MNLNIECEPEEDGRWLAEVMELPGALAYGRTQDEAMVKAQALTLRVLADQLEHGKIRPVSINVTLQAPREQGPSGLIITESHHEHDEP